MNTLISVSYTHLAAGGAPGTDTGGSYHMWIWHGAALA